MKRKIHMDGFFNEFKGSALHGIEIGAYDRPYFTRKEFPNMKYADVFSTNQLRALAIANNKRNVDNVETVDFVIGQKTLKDLVPANKCDFVFCSHVLEHVPDLITTLRDIEVILKPKGRLLCAYPDKEYTFDITRKSTSFKTLVDRFENNLRKPDPDTVYDYFINHKRVFTGKLWHKLEGGIGANTYTKQIAEKKSKLAKNEYVDVHTNIFNSSEFVRIIEKLNQKGLIKMSIEKYQHTKAPLNEFFVVFQKNK